MEKATEYNVESPPYDEHKHGVDVRKLQFGEAEGIFGDAETAERYGYVSRGCDSPPIQQ
jgi:amino acid transporter